MNLGVTARTDEEVVGDIRVAAAWLENHGEPFSTKGYERWRLTSGVGLGYMALSVTGRWYRLVAAAGVDCQRNRVLRADATPLEDCWAALDLFMGYCALRREYPSAARYDKWRMTQEPRPPVNAVIRWRTRQTWAELLGVYGIVSKKATHGGTPIVAGRT